MSAVQAGGGKGSGQRPGGTPGGRPAAKPKPSPGQRGASSTAKGSSQRPAAPGRKPGASKTPPGGRGGGKGRSGGYAPGPPRRFSPSTLAFVAVGVVVVVIVALVVVKVSSGSSAPPKSTIAPVDTPAPASLVSAVTSVPVSVSSAVGLPLTTIVAPPTIKTGQPKLTIGGKPGAVFIGGEFCPLCGAERWAIVLAFGRFGTFTGLQETTSSPWDSDPSTPTFSFYGATYSSPYLTFDTSEHESNDSAGLGTRTILQPLTPLESQLWAKYDNPEGFPFLDIGNKAFVLTPSYNPQTLANLDQQDVASKLSNPKSPVTQAIVGTANYLTAAICNVTGQMPASVCSASIVSKAAKAMGLS